MGELLELLFDGGVVVVQVGNGAIQKSVIGSELLYFGVQVIKLTEERRISSVQIDDLGVVGLELLVHYGIVIG